MSKCDVRPPPRRAADPAIRPTRTVLPLGGREGRRIALAAAAVALVAGCAAGNERSSFSGGYLGVTGGGSGTTAAGSSARTP